ncbi:MAG: Xaa-Pro peptidase family protein [Kiritimatiellales bacterium]|nr:Xaa-Pro peptidase family protein [Kiritimatiellales bacterium]
MMIKSPSQLLRLSKTQTFLVSDLTNIRYLTGLDLSYGFVLVSQRSWRLFVDDRYIEAATKSVKNEIQVLNIDDLEKYLNKCKECGFESDNVTVEQLRNWKRKYKNTKFVRRKGIIEEFRRSKSEIELKRFRRAQRITKEMLRRVTSALRSFPTEKDLAWKLETWARELGADSLSFDPIVAFGTNTSCPHHHPTSRRLKKGHIVQIDVGARYKGYCADRSEVFFTDQPTGLQKKVYRAVEEAKDAALEKVVSGVTTHALDKAARKVLSKYDFEEYFTHSLGHGVGLEIHEGVLLTENAPNTKLRKNEIVTIEPGVYLPGKFGIRLEEEIVVLK